MDDDLTQLPTFFTAPDRRYPNAFYDLPPQQRANAKAIFCHTAKPYHVANGILMFDDKEVSSYVLIWI